MHAKAATTLLAAALAVAVAALPAAAGQQPKVKERVQVSGLITAIDPIRSTFTLEAGAQEGARTFVVLVQWATELWTGHLGARDDEGENQDEHAVRRAGRAGITDFQVGDRVRLEAFRLDDGRLLCLLAQILNRRVALQPEPIPQELVPPGVVVGKSSSTLTVLDRDGGARVVLVPADTAVTGQRTSFAAIIPNDVVRVEGIVNADNTVTAWRIDVVFAGAYQVLGRITFKSPNQQLLIVNNLVSVNVAPDTRIISDGRPRSLNDLQVGQTVIVIGTPVIIAGVMVAVNAHVITF